MLVLEQVAYLGARGEVTERAVERSRDRRVDVVVQVVPTIQLTLVTDDVVVGTRLRVRVVQRRDVEPVKVEPVDAVVGFEVEPRRRGPARVHRRHEALTVVVPVEVLDRVERVRLVGARVRVDEEAAAQLLGEPALLVVRVPLQEIDLRAHERDVEERTTQGLVLVRLHVVRVQRDVEVVANLVIQVEAERAPVEAVVPLDDTGLCAVGERRAIVRHTRAAFDSNVVGVGPAGIEETIELVVERTRVGVVLERSVGRTTVGERRITRGRVVEVDDVAVRIEEVPRRVLQERVLLRQVDPAHEAPLAILVAHGDARLVDAQARTAAGPDVDHAVRCA